MPLSRTNAVCAVGAVLVLATAACSTSSHPAAKVVTKPSASRPTPASAQLTVAQASGIFTAFLVKFNQLAGDPSLISQVTTGPERTAEEFLNGIVGFKPGTLSGDRFVIPYLTSYPRWFLAAGSAANRRSFMFVMVQQSAGAPWREAADLYDLSAAQIMPDLNYAGFRNSGFAQPISPTDPSLVVSPASLPAAYSRYINDHGHGLEQRNFGAGANTTGYVKLDELSAAGSGARGWRFADHLTPIGQPVYGVRLSTGVAMVVFYTKATITWTALSAGAAMPRTETASYAPPAFIAARLRLSHVFPGLRITATAIDENLVFVPPLGIGKITVEFNLGKAVSFTKS